MAAQPRMTDRLAAAAPSAADERRYRELLLAPPINRWLRPPPLAPLIDPDPGLWLARDLAHWRNHGFGPWVLSDRRGTQLVGRVGLSYTTLAGRRVVELSWVIVPARWGEGLATEAAQAALALAVELGLEQVVAYTLATNKASCRVAEKIGLKPAGEVSHAGLGHLLFAL